MADRKPRRAMNCVVIHGALTRDAETKNYNGFTVSQFTLAVNDMKKAQNGYEDATDFIDVKLFGKTAEAMGKFLLKGASLIVRGRLKQERWQGQDGKNHSRLLVRADDIEMTRFPKPPEGSNGAGSWQDAVQSKEAPQPQYDGTGAFPEDIPF